MLDAATTYDPRVVAMAREWCRILARNPDDIVRSSRGRVPRWEGYAHLMVRLLAAIEPNPDA